MNTVFLYAGQGSQTVGMGKDFYEKYPQYREFVDGIGKELEKDYKTIMHEGPIEELSKTENTQASMAMFAAGVTKLLDKHGIRPYAACGLSLGEYGALFAAGVYSAADYVKITAKRGAYMSEAAKGIESAMSAILGADKETVEDAVKAYKGEGFVTVANYNCTGQYVICGDEKGVSSVEETLKAGGVKRCVRLNVSGPFHTKYMAPAGEKLRALFDEMEFEKPLIPVAHNYTGKINDGTEDIKELLISQVSGSVHMEEDIKELLLNGARDFIEIGPGNAVSGFLKKTAKAMGIEVSVASISTVDDFEKALSERGN